MPSLKVLTCLRTCARWPNRPVGRSKLLLTYTKTPKKVPPNGSASQRINCVVVSWVSNGKKIEPTAREFDLTLQNRRFFFSLEIHRGRSEPRKAETREDKDAESGIPPWIPHSLPTFDSFCIRSRAFLPLTNPKTADCFAI